MLEFFRFDQHVQHVRENQQGDEKEYKHGWSDFFKYINGFEAEVEADQPEGENSDG